MIIGETRGEAAELLGDGSQVQRVMAELHGAQRHRLGWAEADIEREVPLLAAEVERELRAALDVPPAPPGGTSGAAVPAAAARAAVEYAAVVVRHVLARSMRSALRAHRIARTAETP
jgi:hypothetical protein